MRWFRDSECGQAAIEWAGVITIAAVLLVFVIVSGAPALGQQVVRGIYCTVTHMLGERNTCSASGEGAGSNPYEVKCIASTSTNMAQAQVTIAFLQLSDNDTLIKFTYSNGSTTFLMTHQGSAQAQADLGADLSIGNMNIGELDTISGGAFLAGAKEWDFSTPAQAAAFEKDLSGHGPVDQIVHDAVDPFGINPIGGWVLGLFGDHAGSSLPTPTSTYTKAGLSGSLELAGPGSTDAILRASIGDKVTTSGPDKGDNTIFLSVDGNATAGLLGIGGATVQAGGGYTATPGATGQPALASLTLGPNGQPVSAQINLYIAGTAGLSLAGSDIPGISDALKAIKGQAGGGIQYTGTLNLKQHPDDLAALVAAAGGNFAPLADALNADGTQQVQPFTMTTSNLEAGVGAGDGAGLGVKGQVAGSSQSYFGGWVKPPGLAWGDSQCTK